MSATDVVDPDGVRWRVRRRWYPWRRALSLRDVWSATPGGQDSGTTDSGAEDSSLPRNIVLKVFFVAAAAIVWIVFSAAKVVFYAAVVALFLIGSLIELVAELVVMPFTLLLRLLGRSRWPVEITRAGEHFDTRRAPDFAAAGEIRDSLLADIPRGVLPAARAQASRGDSKPEPVGRFED